MAQINLQFGTLSISCEPETHSKPLKFVPATQSGASTGLANARRLAERYTMSIV
jgi:hypothetical protein